MRSRWLSFWIRKSQRILAWLFLATFFWLSPPVFTVLKVVLSIYSPVYYRGWIAASLSVLNPSEFAAATDMLLEQPESRILHSVVDLPWCWGPALTLPWLRSCCSLWCCFCWAINIYGPYWQFLNRLCAKWHAEASHTRLQFYLAFSRWRWGACIQLLMVTFCFLLT